MPYTVVFIQTKQQRIKISKVDSCVSQGPAEGRALIFFKQFDHQITQDHKTLYSCIYPNKTTTYKNQ